MKEKHEKANIFRKCIDKIWFIYLMFFLVGAALIVVPLSIGNISEIAATILLSIGCSIIASDLMGFVFDFIHKKKDKDKLRQRKQLLTDRMSEKAVSAFYFVGRSFKDNFFGDSTSINDLITALKSSKSDSIKMNNFAYYFLKFLYNDLEKCYEGLFVDKEWEGVNSAYMYAGIIAPKEDPTISKRVLLNLYESLRLIESIKVAFALSVYRYKYLREMKNVSVANLGTMDNITLAAMARITPKENAVTPRKDSFGVPIRGHHEWTGPVCGAKPRNQKDLIVNHVSKIIDTD